MPKGLFITFEGLDGSGKTTQLRRLADWLTSRNLSVVTLRQPGGTALGDRIRSIILDSRTDVGHIAPLTEMALMFADRAQAIAEVIQPALNDGKIVLCDRYTDSTEAYQGAGRAIGSDEVLALHRIVCNNLQPDLTILLLPDIEASLARARRRNTRTTAAQGADESRFETENDDFYRRVHAGYQRIAHRDAHRVVAVEDNASIDAIQQRIREAIQLLLASVT